MNKIVGIDLGTSTSEIAILKAGKPFSIPNHLGEVITPSAVLIDENENIIVGQDALEQFILKPEATAIEVKRMMGSKDKVVLAGKEFTPVEVSSFILKYLKGCAETYLNEEVNRAVITVPAYFTNEQRRATVEAGKLAGFIVERIINEPTAAALAYGIDHMQDNNFVLVYDLGGGTLDVTVLEMFDGILEVKASSGNNKLGGKDFDQRIIDKLLGHIKAKYDITLNDDLRAMARLKKEAEKCKIALSIVDSYEVVLPFISEKNGEPINLNYELTRDNFEAMILDLVESTRIPLENALRDAKLAPQDIEIILLVGGSTRIPLVKRFLTDIFGKEPESLVDPDLAVVMGAAIQSGILNKDFSSEKDILITDVCPYTLGIEILDYINGIPVNDVYNEIINRNTTIPVAAEKIYFTSFDDQDTVDIKVYQGDNRMASKNNFLGDFKLSEIPLAPAGTEKIKVRFMYDVNGILQVEATIVSTEESAGISIETTGVTMEKEIDISEWEDFSKAKPYKRIIHKAERKLKHEDSTYFEELVDLIVDFKRAIIEEYPEEELQELEDDLTELLYEMEE
ncbi:MAG TPA: Hsp70 family protein [Clostridiaceae bacterium]